jgi:hypothetical protein
MVGITTAKGGGGFKKLSAESAPEAGCRTAGHTHERYDTERKGFWLKTSLSRNRFSKSQDICCGRVWGGGRLDSGGARRERSDSGGEVAHGCALGVLIINNSASISGIRVARKGCSMAAFGRPLMSVTVVEGSRHVGSRN